jgi:hypothetical protein
MGEWRSKYKQEDNENVRDKCMFKFRSCAIPVFTS